MIGARRDRRSGMYAVATIVPRGRRVKNNGVPVLLNPKNAGHFAWYAAKSPRGMLLDLSFKHIVRVVNEIHTCVVTAPAPTVPFNMSQFAAGWLWLRQELSLVALRPEQPPSHGVEFERVLYQYPRDSPIENQHGQNREFSLRENCDCKHNQTDDWDTNDEI